MGGDGGSTTTARKYIRGQEERKEEGKDAKYDRLMKSQTCAHSNLPLVEPVAACRLGNLFNEELLLAALLEHTLNPTHSRYIRGMKDFRRLKLHLNSAASKETENAQWACPITQEPFNGALPFVVIWTTGHVLSEKAIREMGVDELQVEYGPFQPNDVVKLLPAQHEIEEIVAGIESSRREKKKRKVAERADEFAKTDLGEEQPSSKAATKTEKTGGGHL